MLDWKVSRVSWYSRQIWWKADLGGDEEYIKTWKDGDLWCASSSLCGGILHFAKSPSEAARCMLVTVAKKCRSVEKVHNKLLGGR
jgi:hypothetical protein